MAQAGNGANTTTDYSLVPATQYMGGSYSPAASTYMRGARSNQVQASYNYPREPGGASAGLSPAPVFTGQYISPTTVPTTYSNPQGSSLGVSFYGGSSTAGTGGSSTVGTGGAIGSGLDWLTGTGVWKNYNTWVDPQSGMTYAETARASGLDDATGFSRYYFNVVLPRLEANSGYQRLRGRINQADTGRARRANREPSGTGEPTPTEIQSLRYNPAPTTWRIGG